MIEAFLSSHGLKALKDELKEEIKNFVMFGATSDSDSILDGLVSSETSYEDIEDYIFYKGELQSGYFDSKGLLTYEVNLNNIVSDYYAYGLMILDKNNKSIATIKIPKIKFFENIGGELTIKLPVQGEKNQVIFTHNEYVTRVEFDDYRRQEKVDVLTKANQTLLLALAARDKTKSIKEDFLKIGRKDYFVLSLPENYVGLEEKIDASKNLILWHKLGIKTKTFELLKKYNPNIQKENIVIFEDSIAGIIGAKKTGIKTIAITNTYDKETLLKNGADIVVNRIDEALEYIEL